MTRQYRLLTVVHRQFHRQQQQLKRRQTTMQRELRQALPPTGNQRLQQAQQRHRKHLVPQRWLRLREQEQKQIR